MNWALWISFATISAANIVTPGPANLNTLRRAMELGARRVIPTIMGNALGLAVGGAAFALGIASLVIASSLAWTAVRIIGVAYLMWLALKLLYRREVLVLDADAHMPIASTALFAEAFLLAVSNPKALLFYMALFPQILDGDSPLAPQAGILVFTYCGLSILSLSIYATLAQTLRSRFLTPRRYTRFRQISGLILLGFALKLLIEIWA